jgi:GTP-binding protein
MPSIVAIIGRPNVGKSVLFNRILGRRDAIVHDTPGITRDRHYAEADWFGKKFVVVDTGGLVPDSDEPMESAIERQAQMAVAEAEVILLVVDVRAGVTPLDQKAADVVRRTSKPIFIVANKVDSGAQENHAYEFSSLGLGEPVMISALKGRNFGDLLDLVADQLPDEESAEPEEGPDAIKIAVVGKPNVGKSSLVNAIIGKETVIVSDVPGTTRDSIDTKIVRHGVPYILIDTAGLRRKARISSDIEFYSFTRTVRSLERCDVAVVLVDAIEGISTQEMRIIAQVNEAGKGLILAFNKWDLVDTTEMDGDDYLALARDHAGFADYAPVMFLSAHTKRGVTQLLEKVDQVKKMCILRVPTGELNRVVESITSYYPPPSSSNGRLTKVFYCTQVKIAPPTFVFFVNHPESITDSYKRYLSNQLRENFSFEGTAIRVLIRGREGRALREW